MVELAVVKKSGVRTASLRTPSVRAEGVRSARATHAPRVVLPVPVQHEFPVFSSVAEAVRVLKPARPVHVVLPKVLRAAAQMFLAQFPGTSYYAVK